MAQTIMPAIRRDFYIEDMIVVKCLDAVYFKCMERKRVGKLACLRQRFIKKFL